MTESNGKTRHPGFHRLTLRDIARDRADGLLTAKGAIFYSVIAAQKPGTTIKFNPKDLAKQLLISKTAFYRAIAELKTDGRIDFEVEGRLIISIPIDENTGLPEYLAAEELSQKWDSDSQKRENLSQKGDSDSQKRDSDSQKRDSDSQKWEKLSQKRENEPPKPAPSSRFRASPDKIDIDRSINIEERESAGDPEENDGEFKKWLLNKANLLPQKPALLEQWIDKEMLKESNRREFNQHQEKQTSPTAIPIPEILPLEQISQNDYWAAVNARSGVTSDG